MTAELLSTLRRRGVELWVEDGRLRYRAPTGALSPEHRDLLVAHREQILRQLGNAGHSGVGHPLSYSQESLWVLQRLEPESPYYNVPTSYSLRGALSAERLERSLEQVVQRHSILRAVFRATEEGPVQEIGEDPRVSLERVDLRSLPASERSREARRRASERAQVAFDLERGPLLRTTLYQLGEQEYLYFQNLHHIVSDGWSRRIFNHELSAAYDGSIDLPDLPLQFTDFAREQRRIEEEEGWGELLDFWQGRLADHSGVFELPADARRSDSGFRRGACVRRDLPRDVRGALRELGRQEGATWVMTVLAAFAVCLQRHSGEDDLVVGMPVAGRMRAELEGLIGPFVNTLALRLDLGGRPSFRELLQRVRTEVRQGYSHQEMPFERLVNALRPGRQPQGNPIFQVMLAPGASENVLRLPGVAPSRMVVEDTGTTKFDLSLLIDDDGRDARFRWEYDRDLFLSATMQRWVDHFAVLLEGVLADPDQRIDRLPLLTEAERRQAIRWSRSEPATPPAACVHRRFGASAAADPDRCALVYRGAEARSEHSYRELEERAAELAGRLVALGVGPDVPVGILLERSPELAVAALGVLEAGGAIAALDPGHPTPALQASIRAAGVRLVVTCELLATRIADLEDVLPCCLDRAEEGAPSQPPGRAVSGEDLVYVIQTSGTTGEPKAVGFEHRALANLVAWQLAQPGFGERPRVLQLAPFGFCVSFQEMFGSWAAGGTLVMVDEATRRDPAAWPGLLVEQRIEVLYLTPTALSYLAETALVQGVLPRQLRQVITAGEPLRLTAATRELFSRLDGCRLHNHYGASETHVVLHHTLEGPVSSWPESVPVGRPISNVSVHLLDAAGHPVPAGVAGEIHVGGVGRFRAYLNDRDLTARKLRADPLDPSGTSRLYRTGDRGRYLADGILQLLGRCDDQVKIRGFRVEPGAVESCLRRHPEVRDAAVLAVAKGDRDCQLAAFVVRTDPGIEQDAPWSSRLRSFVRSQLPEPMVPASWVAVETLPLAANGKLDREWLLDRLARFGGDKSSARVAPRNELERQLVAIWSEVLGSETTGVHDDFFELGGHSLAATRVVARIRSRLGVPLPLRTLFEAPTVAGLAVAIARLESEALEPDALGELLDRVEGSSESGDG